MADQPKAAGIPKIKSYEDFDVLSGYDGLDRTASKESTFHTSVMDSGDAAFMKKAELMEGSGSEIEAEDEAGENQSDKDAESKLKTEEKESSL